MSMFDDLDPMFEPSPDAALAHVATRVHGLRLRRRLTVMGAVGTVAVVTVLTVATFASGASGRTAASPSPTTRRARRSP